MVEFILLGAAVFLLASVVVVILLPLSAVVSVKPAVEYILLAVAYLFLMSGVYLQAKDRNAIPRSVRKARRASRKLSAENKEC